jgi:ABC-type spermidine/putrescine transport system permease subunit II
MTEPLRDPETSAADPVRTTAETTDKEATPRLLVGLWLALAVGLVVAPFLRLYTYSYLNDSTVIGGYSLNAWGEILYDDVGVPSSGHAARVGIVFALLAIALAVAAVLSILRRDLSWPFPVGAIASGVTVAVLGVVLLELESQASRTVSEGGISTEFDSGAGTWAVLVLTVLAVVASVLSWVQHRRHPS